MMNFVHLGEFVRVRVVECVPSTGVFRVSMRAEEDTEINLRKFSQFVVKGC